MSSGHPGLTNDFQEKGSPFNWSAENVKEIEIIKSKYPIERVQSAVMPLLYLAQKQNDNWLSSECIEKISETLSMPKIRVAEVASFYSMFNLKPVGKNTQAYSRKHYRKSIEGCRSLQKHAES